MRVVFLLAGSVTLTGVVLAATVSTWFLLLPALAGANQLLMVAAGWCPMSLLLTRLGVEPDCITQRATAIQPSADHVAGAIPGA